MHFFAHPLISTMLGLKRICPQCSQKQIAPREKKYEPISCKKCGAEIPPPPRKKD